jgi:hypothetical protein
LQNPLNLSHPANLSTFSFIFGSLAFLRAGAVTARGVNKRIATKVALQSEHCSN